jgi:hypothetical protein
MNNIMNKTNFYTLNKNTIRGFSTSKVNYIDENNPDENLTGYDISIPDGLAAFNDTMSDISNTEVKDNTSDLSNKVNLWNTQRERVRNSSRILNIFALSRMEVLNTWVQRKSHLISEEEKNMLADDLNSSSIRAANEAKTYEKYGAGHSTQMDRNTDNVWKMDIWTTYVRDFMSRFAREPRDETAIKILDEHRGFADKIHDRSEKLGVLDYKIHSGVKELERRKNVLNDSAGTSTYGVPSNSSAGPSNSSAGPSNISAGPSNSSAGLSTRSLVDDYANPNLDMPSYMDPED